MTYKQVLAVAPFVLGAEESSMHRKAVVLCRLLPSLCRHWTHPSFTLKFLKAFPGLFTLFPLFTEGQKWDLLNTVDWLFQDISGRAIITGFVHKGDTYYLPEDNLVKESIVAFAFADDYFTRFISTGDSTFINLLIACLARQERQGNYRQDPGWEGDIREPFSTERTKERARHFHSLPGEIKNALLLYFMGSKKYIHQHYEVLFQATAPPEQLYKTDFERRRVGFGQKKIPRPDFGWLGVIYELAEVGTFGSFNSVKHMFLHTCCYYLAKKRYDYEDQTK